MTPRFVAVDTKAIKRPSLVIADSELAPLAGVPPPGVETSVVNAEQLVNAFTQLRTNISCAPPGFGAVAPRFVAVEVKETKSTPVEAIAGLELGPSAGVVPFEVETRNVVGAHVDVVTPLQVSRTKICAVTPSKVRLETRFVAREAKAT